MLNLSFLANACCDLCQAMLTKVGLPLQLYDFVDLERIRVDPDLSAEHGLPTEQAVYLCCNKPIL